jgi:predicted amidophosphoribosyltransferase
MKLQRSQRLKNLQNAFVVNLALVAELQGSSTIVLVDDVVTTGATLFEAKVTLASHFPNTNIICLAIAH